MCCNQDQAESTIGTILVLVVDNGSEKTPVADVEIIITPGDIKKKTNTLGMVRFEVHEGDYFVDAEVCCLGPGYIHYHEPVTVTANQSVEVKLLACLRCL